MKTLCAILVFIIIQDGAACPAPLPLKFHILMEVEQGMLKGEILDLVTEDGQYYSFKGIPYAEPPIGKLRFKPPRPAAAWDGVKSATKHGAVCPQVDILTNVLTPGNEDCLFLNVYSPNLTPDTLLPVLVFIHGGGYKSGSGNADSLGPDFLVRKNMVVVTFNYRLDALGFLSLGTKEVPGNAGLKDQVLALKWVQKNIKHFGGDARQVTIMGQSAGSASVAFHISSPMSKGLFHRAIAMSGSPFCDWALAIQPERRAFALGKQLQGREFEDPDALLLYLQNVSYIQLVHKSPYILASEEINYNIIKMYHFAPVFEKYEGEDNFLTKNTFKNAESLNKVDVLFGHTDQEVLPGVKLFESKLLEVYSRYPENFVPRKISSIFPPYSILDLSIKIRNYYFGNKSVGINSMKEFITYANDVSFVYDIIRYFEKMPNIEYKKKYYYQFSSVSNRNVYGNQGAEYAIGAGHLDDLMYLFDPKALNIPFDINSREFQLIEQLTTLFTNFAKYGNPTPDSSFNVTWPVFEPTTMKYVDIGNYLKVLSVNDNENFTFLKTLFNFFDINNWFYVLQDCNEKCQ